MELLSDIELKSQPSLRAAMTRAAMSRATRRVVRYNWYAAGHAVGVAPSVEEMIDYGTVAAVAYHEDGQEFGLALDSGIKLMSSWAYNELKGVITTAKVVTNETGQKYAPGCITGGTIMVPAYMEIEYNTIELIASLPLDNDETTVLMMHAHAYTFEEISEEMGLSLGAVKGTYRLACSKAAEILDA